MVNIQKDLLLAKENQIDDQMEAGHFRKARLAIRQLLKRDKLNFTANFQMALLELESNRPKSALKYAKIVVKNYPEAPNAWLNLGVAYGRVNQFARAINCYKKELALNPESPEALHNLGLNFYRRRDWRKAINPLQECLRLNHSSEEVRGPLADSLYRCGRIQDEIALYKRCLIENPKDLWARSNLGAALMDVGEYRRALITLRIAKAMGAEFPNLIRNLQKIEMMPKELGVTNRGQA